MSDTSVNNKLIAKNTLMLYFRMLFTMVVTLYTSRVVLQTLGVEDFGIYNVVGGIIMMFTFINSAMVSSSQRFLNIELATGNGEKLCSIFNTSLQIHTIIAFIIFILGETIGLWFLLEKLVISETRMVAAMWVYQCSIVSCIFTIITAPFNAVIIAHEKMSIFAYISIIEVLLKLLIVYILSISFYDRLIVYAILILLVQLTISCIYLFYCHKNFDETKLKAKVNKQLLREMSGFAGWSFMGNLASIFFTQGLNIMLNIFFGPIVNAARGISVQIQTTVQQFVSNFQMALNPQITKNYAYGNFVQMHNLMFRSARFSFLLLFFISLPILLETEFLLSLWLGTIPENAVVFTQIMICISMLYTIANPCMIANQATGKVKQYQVAVGSLLLAIIPISYFALKLGAPAYSVFIVHFVLELIAQIVRMNLLKKLIHLSIWQYIINIYIPVIATIIVAIVLPLFIRLQFNEGWARFISVGFTSLLSVGTCSFFIGLTKNERLFFVDKVYKILKCNS